MNALARSAPVLNALGHVVLMFAATLLVPWIFAVVGDDGAQRSFDIALFVTAGSGLALTLSTRRFKRDLQTRDGFLLVTLVNFSASSMSFLAGYVVITFLILHRYVIRPSALKWALPAVATVAILASRFGDQYGGLIQKIVDVGIKGQAGGGHTRRTKGERTTHGSRP